MRKKSVVLVIVISVLLLSITVQADSTFNSKGKIEFGSDVVFDSSDLATINNEILTG